jgi:hypothetical protein
VWFFNSHARLRVHRAPGFPCALDFQGHEVQAKLAQTGGEIARVCLLLFEN